VGTHALFQPDVHYANLALVVIDEQHRFGVQQRMALKHKGAHGEGSPHQLIMTATPIPRTLAMIGYADLDSSVIDTLPPGRQPIVTVAISNQRRDEMMDRVRTVCMSGRQVYWVCTLIEESEQLESQAAEELVHSLRSVLVGVTIGLVHGRLKSAEKEEIMQRFKAGEIQLLVATTVIEVGVDVPNATLMIIENAERLGLAQLHQIRGRVGRGQEASQCVLLYQPPLSALARQRLDTLRKSNDGFEISRKDLQLRGPGEVLGTRQTGEIIFRVADLGRDEALLEAIPQTAKRLMQSHPAAAGRLVKRWIGANQQFAGV
jgi:ATP-dependent DNA helicase RecG